LIGVIVILLLSTASSVSAEESRDNQRTIDSLELEKQEVDATIADHRSVLETIYRERKSAVMISLANKLRKKAVLQWRIDILYYSGDAGINPPPRLDLTEAIDTYISVLTDFPEAQECSDALYSVGLSRYEMATQNKNTRGEIDRSMLLQSVTDFERLVVAYPDYAERDIAKLKQGESFELLGLYQEALESIGGLESTSDTSISLRALSIASASKYELGRYRDAIVDFEKSAELLMAQSGGRLTWESTMLVDVAHNIAACIARFGGLERYQSQHGSLRGRPYECSIYSQLGALSAENSGWQEAISALEELLERCPSSSSVPTAMAVLSNAYFETNDLPGSRRMRDALVQMFGHESARWPHASEDERKEVSAAIKQACLPIGTKCFNIAIEARNDGNSEKALQYFEMAREIFDSYLVATPEDETTAEVLFYAGQAAFQTERFDLAVAYYKRARQASKTEPIFVTESGGARFELGSASAYNIVLAYREAIAKADSQLSASGDSAAFGRQISDLQRDLIRCGAEFLESYPDDRNATYVRRLRASANYGLGNYVEAAKEWEAVLPKILDSETLLQVRLRIAWAYLRASMYDEALNTVKAVSHTQEDPQLDSVAIKAMYHSSKRLEAAGRTDQAVSGYLYLAAEYTGAAEAVDCVQRAALLLWDLEQPDSALLVLDQLSGDPKRLASLLFRFGRSAQDKRDWTTALKCYKKLTQGHPDCPQAAHAYFNAGICLDSVDHCTEAANSYNKVADLFPDSSFALTSRFLACSNLRTCDSTAAGFAASLERFLVTAAPLLDGQLSISDPVGHQRLRYQVLQALIFSGERCSWDGSWDEARSFYQQATSLYDRIGNPDHVELTVASAYAWLSLGRIAASELSSPPKGTEALESWLAESGKAVDSALMYFVNCRDLATVQHTPESYTEISSLQGRYAALLFMCARHEMEIQGIDVWSDRMEAAFIKFSDALATSLECLHLGPPFAADDPAFVRCGDLAASWQDSLFAMQDVWCDGIKEYQGVDTSTAAGLKRMLDAEQRWLDIGTVFYERYHAICTGPDTQDLPLDMNDINQRLYETALACGRSQVRISELIRSVADAAWTESEREQYEEQLQQNLSEQISEATTWLRIVMSSPDPALVESAIQELESLNRTIKELKGR